MRRRRVFSLAMGIAAVCSGADKFAAFISKARVSSMHLGKAVVGLALKWAQIKFIGECVKISDAANSGSSESIGSAASLYRH